MELNVLLFVIGSLIKWLNGVSKIPQLVKSQNLNPSFSVTKLEFSFTSHNFGFDVKQAYIHWKD